MASKFVIYETYKIDESEKNYIGKSSLDKIMGKRHHIGDIYGIKRKTVSHGINKIGIADGN